MSKTPNRSRDTFRTLKTFSPAPGKTGQLYSLPALAETFPSVSRLPVSLRIVLESLLRHEDGIKVTSRHIEALANWEPNGKRAAEIPFTLARVVLQDFTGIPLLVDLAAMRSAAQRLGKSAGKIEPLVPVDLVVDHSVMIDYFRRPDALDLNMKLEFQRNKERYQLMKWGTQAFQTLKVVPPGIGIVHQVNLEYLSRGVHKQEDVFFPDSLVGTDSHTTMINGIGVVGWGVGGIEAEAAMLGQPLYFLTPDVVGVKLTGQLQAGSTATDLVLTITEALRKEGVVGKFVEFFGDGAKQLSAPDRATIANMAPEYGGTMGFFPVDEQTLAYLEGTGRTPDELSHLEHYLRAQQLFGIPPSTSEVCYSKKLTLDLSSVRPSVAGPKRPQDRIDLSQVGKVFDELLVKPTQQNGFGKPNPDLNRGVNIPGIPGHPPLRDGDILIAAITSCTNTSNPSVLIAAGLLAKKALELGLKTPAHIKTSLAPGSRVVTEYLQQMGLLPYLEQLGFGVTAYGCTTCIGNSGDLLPEQNDAIAKNDLVCAAVLSGNRNFEARIHPSLRANFLASPPLVVAYSLAGSIRINLTEEPLGKDPSGNPVYLRDIWPSQEEISSLLPRAMDPAIFRRLYQNLAEAQPLWKAIASTTGQVYTWPKSSYIAEPPFFQDFSLVSHRRTTSFPGCRALCLFGDSITTDHISPAGAIKATTPAGKYLAEQGIQEQDFNSYGARRGNHEVMIRGTFANIRIKNLMVPLKPDGAREEGGITIHQPSGERMSIYDAAMRYLESKTPTVIFAGEEYGTGSSRDWAAKGTQLLGVVAVIARSFERIHRSNLVGMGVLPLQLQGTDSVESLGIKGDEQFDISLPDKLTPQEPLTLIIRRADGTRATLQVASRIDTPIEVEYYNHGGILPFVLRSLLLASDGAAA